MRSQSGFRPYFVGPIIYHPSASVKNYSAWWIFRRRFSLLQGLSAPEYDQGFDCSETALNRPGAPMDEIDLRIGQHCVWMGHKLLLF